MTTPLRYSPAVEQIAPDEAETIAKLNEAFTTILERTSADYGHAVRSVHAKAHGLLAGTLTVAPGLPPELAQGLFARPGEHRVFLRMSTNAGDILPDVIGLPRGLALKVLDVAGERIPGAEGTSPYSAEGTLPDGAEGTLPDGAEGTQDFIFVNAPTFQAKTPGQFLANLKLLAATTDRMEGTKKAVSAVLSATDKALTAIGHPSGAVRSLGGAPNVDPLGETFFTATAFRYGDYIAKLSLVPVSPGLVARTGTLINASEDPDAIRSAVRAEMADTDAMWELRVQLCRDLEKQPVEDATVEWLETDTPFVTVATIHAAPQDSWSYELIQRVDEAMRFSVWTGLAAHRPLGAINRVRRDTYDHSARFRKQFNRCPVHEPA